MNTIDSRPISRRWAVTALAATLAACGSRLGHAPGAKTSGPKRLDATALDRGFPALAERARPGVFAMGVMAVDAGQSWYWNTDKRFPLAGLFMAPMVGAALAEVDARQLGLNQPVPIGPLDLSPPPSLINQRWPTPPEGHAGAIPVLNLMTLALQQGDNTAADVLMQRIGGPGAVTAWLESKGVTDMAVDRYAREFEQDAAGMESFHPAWKDERAWLAARDTVPAPRRQSAMNIYLTDQKDSTTLEGAINFVAKLGAGELLSPASTATMLKLLSASTDIALLQAGLPKDAVWAHKSASARTDLGFTPVVADMGLATFADGRRYALAAFLTGSTAVEQARDALFADAGRLMTNAAT